MSETIIVATPSIVVTQVDTMGIPSVSGVNLYGVLWQDDTVFIGWSRLFDRFDTMSVGR